MAAEILITDSTGSDVLFPREHGRGLDLEQRPRGGYASFAAPFPAELRIPRSDWQGIIQELDARQATQRHVAAQAGLPCKDQATTNYCWINSPTYCLEYLRVYQNEPKVVLSPASGGAVIKGGRNVGGWGSEAITFIADKGLAPVERWPANSLDLRHNTPDTRQLALKYRFVDGWWDLRTEDDVISCILRGWPVSSGYNWWSHQVTDCGLRWIGGSGSLDRPVQHLVQKQIRNSWGMRWGEEGYGYLEGGRLLADDAICPRVALAG